MSKNEKQKVHKLRFYSTPQRYWDNGDMRLVLDVKIKCMLKFGNFLRKRGKNTGEF